MMINRISRSTQPGLGYSSRPTRHGFALLVTIGLLGFLSLVMVGMSQAFITQARRTKAQAADAQLRQLLIAGAKQATDIVAKQPELPKWEQTMALPALLGTQDALLSMTCEPGFSGLQFVTIKATLGDETAIQKLTFNSGSKSASVSAVSRQQINHGGR